MLLSKHGDHGAPPLLSEIMPKHDKDGGDISKKILADSWGQCALINSLTAIGAHERQRFNELRGNVVSRRVFIRSQSLIAR
jgi:hypothetical protein